MIDTVSFDHSEFEILGELEASPDAIKSPLKVYVFRYGEPSKTAYSDFFDIEVFEYQEITPDSLKIREIVHFLRYNNAGDLSYFGYRYYDTNTGSWLSREPLGEDESINLYSYCGNDPINKVDYLGLSENRYENIQFLLSQTPRAC